MANQSLYGELFSSLKGLTVQDVTSTGNNWMVEAASSQDSTQCPGCGVVSRRGIAVIGARSGIFLSKVRVMLKLHVARRRCRTPECRYQIFTERLPSVIAPYARPTD